MRTVRLAGVARRLAAARDQMEETERVLGWLRDESWMGGADVLVSVAHYTGRLALEWVTVDRVVQGDAAPYPIRGTIKDPTRSLYERRVDEHGVEYPHRIGSVEVQGQWAFWEVADVRPLSETYPEILELHPDFPRPMRTCPTSWAAGVNQGVIW